MKTQWVLLNVADKTGIVEFAYGLNALGYGIISSGSTAKTLRQSELEVSEIKDITRFPDILDGKVRMTHPKIFAGVTANRQQARDISALRRHEIPPIDIVAVNLYPISENIRSGNLTPAEALEYMDIGGASVLRAAASNFFHVAAICDPIDYQTVLDNLNETGRLSPEFRRELAAKAFYHVAYCDSTMARYMGQESESLPDDLVISLKKTQDFGYGENPHQKAALYSLSGARAWGLSAASLIHGRALLFNHYLDLEAATEMVAEFTRPACAIVKHTHPCGAATSNNLTEAMRLAFNSDRTNCQGGITALNKEVDGQTASFISEKHLECVLAPEFSQSALNILRLKKELRLLTLSSSLLSPYEIQIHSLSGGLLVENKNNQTLPRNLRIVTSRKPTEAEMIALKFAWRIAKHAKTHAIVIARGTQTIGIGCGQPSSLEALKVALPKMREKHPVVTPGSAMVMACDGPIPLGCVHEALKAGLTTIIQPGGSSEDAESIKVCNHREAAMVFTGLRHFRH